MSLIVCLGRWSLALNVLFALAFRISLARRGGVVWLGPFAAVLIAGQSCPPKRFSLTGLIYRYALAIEIGPGSLLDGAKTRSRSLGILHIRAGQF